MQRVRQLIAEMSTREDSRLEGRTVKARRNLDAALGSISRRSLGLLILGSMLFAINRDVGRRQALEKALRDQAALQERFMAILGHDLRNPLNAVSMAARRLRQANVSERWTRSIDYVHLGRETDGEVDRSPPRPLARPSGWRHTRQSRAGHGSAGDRPGRRGRVERRASSRGNRR